MSSSYTASYYRQHLFFCTNLRKSGERCCAQGGAEELRNYAKKALKKLDLHGVGLYRVNTAGCLGRCDEGPVLVIYPEGVWYSYRTYSDIDEIIQRHLLKGEKVERLLLPPIVSHP